MKVFQARCWLAASFLLAGAGVQAQDTTHAGQAVNEAGQSSAHASASAAHSIAASGQVTSGLLAVPLLSGAAVSGSVANTSAGSGNALMQAATAPIGTPLPISQETITVVPPDVALKSRTVKP